MEENVFVLKRCDLRKKSVMNLLGVHVEEETNPRGRWSHAENGKIQNVSERVEQKGVQKQPNRNQ